MRVPVEWLRQYVSFDLTIPELCDVLTFSGLEIEGVETVGSTFEGVVVGEVRGFEQHPNADRLRLCRVFDGSEELPIVCGAANFEEGDKIVLATVGAELPGGMVLKKTKIRGELSMGMMCAQDELGLGQGREGIMILDASLTPGTAFSEVAGPPDVVLEVEVTPNRPDCLSMIGIARELAAMTGTNLVWPEVALHESGEAIESLTSVDVQDAHGCPHYVARVMHDVKIGPSPDWMSRRLSLSGVRPINNVVDVTNYVLLECGQPLHAFDKELLSGERVVVRRAVSGERLATLDGVDQKISPEMLVIADADTPVAVAGVMGGAGSEIRDETTRVLLESASFNASSVRKTAKALGLSTDSSYRFERGVDVNLPDWASRRASQLLVEHAGATLQKGAIDVYPAEVSPSTLECRFGRVRSLLGVSITDDEIVDLLGSIELALVERTDDSCVVSIPTFRVDLNRETDLIEEVVRLYGLDKIPSPAPRARLVPGASDDHHQSLTAARAQLVGLGLSEVVHYSFLSETLVNVFDPGDGATRLILPNPISEDHTMMRNSLVPQLVETLGRNRSHQIREAGLFEVGRVFRVQDDGSYSEEDHLVVGAMGPIGRSGLDQSADPTADEMFLWMKGLLESLFEGLHLPAPVLEPLAVPCLEPGYSVAIMHEGELCGALGLLVGRIRGEWRFSDPVGLFEVNLEHLLGHVFDSGTYVPVSVFPPVDRDFALIVPEGMRHEEIVKTIWRLAPKELTRVELFDIYTGEAVAAGHKSLAYSLTYQSSLKTMTDKQTNKFHEKIKSGLVKELGVELR